ncbi:hypothetical protein C8R43DRAFT_1235669 [Mycena crocata]|nr:hypothetical protein C8R43DRAFT_1235669 [Mycena crocata]
MAWRPCLKSDCPSAANVFRIIPTFSRAHISLMPAISPLFLVIMYAGALLVNLTSMSGLIASIIIHPTDKHDWFLLLTVILGLFAGGCAWNSWRCWKLHKSQAQTMPFFVDPKQPERRGKFVKLEGSN